MGVALGTFYVITSGAADPPSGRAPLTALSAVLVALDLGFLTRGPEELSPVDGVCVAQVAVRRDDHVPVTDLLEGAQPQGRDVQPNDGEREAAAVLERRKPTP